MRHESGEGGDALLLLRLTPGEGVHALLQREELGREIRVGARRGWCSRGLLLGADMVLNELLVRLHHIRDH